jgi:Ca-activated chloride channel family protein
MSIPLLSDFRFAVPELLWLLLPALALAVLTGARGRLPAIEFAAMRHFGDSGRNTKGSPGGIGSLFFVAALCAGVIALARPQRIHQYEVSSGEGVEIVLAIDVSFSMCVEDFVLGQHRVNRLTAAKAVIKDFVKGRPDDRIGLIIFSGRPHTLGPLTVDHEWLLDTIDREIHFKHPIAPATAIGTAIAESAKRLSKREAASKVAVLITDGDQTVDGLTPEDAAKLAATLGIKVYPIAIGTPGEHYAPLIRRNLTTSFDFAKLERVAEITGAKAYHAKDTNSLKAIFDQIDSLEKSEVERRKVVETTELFQWPAAAAALLALAGIVWELSLGRVSPS